MNWDRIEEEWTTMTRRIRADWRDNPTGVGVPRKGRDTRLSMSGPPADAGPSDKGPEHGNLPTLR